MNVSLTGVTKGARQRIGAGGVVSCRQCGAGINRLMASGAPRPASPSNLDFSLLVILSRSLCGGFLRCLSVVMASVGDVGESSHDHDRDDHGATEEGNVRMTVREAGLSQRTLSAQLRPWGRSDSMATWQSAWLSHCPYGLQGFCFCLVTLAAINR